jgi:predicted secreted protein
MTLVRHAAASLWKTIAVVTVVSLLAVATAVAGIGLGVGGAIGIYFVLWWTGLFAVLPFGVLSQAESGQVARGTDPGAPVAPALREKAIWTTLLAAVALAVTAMLLPLLDG